MSIPCVIPLPNDDWSHLSNTHRSRSARLPSLQLLPEPGRSVDHIIPQALGGSDELNNLCLACWDCNRIKQTHVTGIDPHTGQRVSLYDPGRQLWDEHFAWGEDATLIVGLTPAGRATIVQLQLNRPILVRARERWIRAGWHPPHS